MNEPTTAAGRTLVKAFVPAQGSDAGSIPLRPATVVRVAVPRIEAEARADLAKRVEERVTGLWPAGGGGESQRTDWRVFLVAIVREEVAR